LLPNSLITFDIFNLDEIGASGIDTDYIETADNYQIYEQELRLRKKLKILNETDEEYFINLIKTNKSKNEKGNLFAANCGPNE